MSPALQELNMFMGRIFHQVLYQLPKEVADIHPQRSLICGVHVDFNNMPPLQGSKSFFDT